MRWLALVVVVALSGCIKDFDDGPLRNELSIHDVDVSAPEVRSGAIDLNVDVFLDNQMSRSGDVVVEVRAFDKETRLLAETASRDIGRIDRDKTVLARVPITIPRASGYDIQVTVIQDERVHTRASVAVSNLGALEPNVFDTGLQISSMDFHVENVTGSSVRITAGVYVTNEGTSDSDALRMQVKAREVSTALIADDASVDLESIPPEETHEYPVTLSVPDGYNYVVEAIVWDGNIIVERGEGNVQLLPTFERPADTEIEVTDPDVRDFVRARGDGDNPNTPGLPIAAAIAVIGGIAWMKRRK